MDITLKDAQVGSITGLDICIYDDVPETRKYVVGKDAVKATILGAAMPPFTINLDCGCTLTINAGDVIRTVECPHSTPERRRYLTKVETRSME